MVLPHSIIIQLYTINTYANPVCNSGIVCHNTGEEEADPMLELAMEYVGALGTIIFDKLCCLHNLTEAQVGRNQFTMDVAIDRLDGVRDTRPNLLFCIHQRYSEGICWRKREGRGL